MQITRQADYAVRAVLYLSRLGQGNRAATSQIAEDQHIPPSFLAKIISQLSIAGLLHTSRGARGGVTLARAAEEITLLEVVESIDGPIRLNECVHSDGMCSFTESCPLVSIWQDAQSDLVNRLKDTNFGQFLEK
ncbi:MAG: Rrf2 family transcriptional regulator [Anaerolineae bacterium]|jgi:Rrf2 family protein|nr:Rrf2 family transcriptional regulator [Anaerolineae bacterium]MBT7071676.1 Rrf2 family transcriptional regulator [Anaerolineae bacterium]MBT7325202.1 Rrf2 family transcriptional regulator [Anaerolineae bacterium]